MKKIPVLICLFGLSACSLKSAALRSAGELLDAGKTTYYEEPDFQLARETLGSQLKFVEGLLESRPRDARLNRLAAEGFGAYAFLFFEDSEPERAKGFYLRGRDRALAALDRRPALRGLAAQPLARLEAALTRTGQADVPALYWAAFCWSGLINLSRDDPQAVAELPKAAAMMKRVYELDKSFNFAGPDLFFGVYFASRPKLMGGDPEKAAEHFTWARRITGGKYLLAYLLEAKTLAVARQDRASFENLLREVAAAPAGGLPGARLADEAAKLKAAALLNKIDDLF
ncbi:MAG: TRAP transporter TatT component family protein [Elusimicrobia bacterium]|nr:TRAP transporter TatT component family protein [Elusimicrobiota bacterium]